jgi:hypothetical protein
VTLSAITRGKIRRPRRILAYGPEGVGKSTFGSDAPGAVFLAPEDGTAQLDAARLPEPATWADAMAGLDALGSQPHEFKTLVIDTLDWLEPLISAHVCSLNGWKSLEDPGYGRGAAAALDVWRALLARLDGLRNRCGMDIILLAHSQMRTFRNPEGEDFDRYELKLQPKASGLCKEWCDAVLFVNYETLTHKKDGRTRGLSTGARFIHTERRAAFDAKNRYSLPEQLPLSWPDFDAAAKAGQVDTTENLRAQVDALLPRVDADTRGKAEAWLSNAANSNPRSLAQMADRLRARAEILNPNNSAEQAQETVK